MLLTEWLQMLRQGQPLLALLPLLLVRATLVVRQLQFLLSQVQQLSVSRQQPPFSLQALGWALG